MRVLIVNTSEKTGGAAVAANRLMEALKNNGVKAKMLVRDKETDQFDGLFVAPVMASEVALFVGAVGHLGASLAQAQAFI